MVKKIDKGGKDTYMYDIGGGQIAAGDEEKWRRNMK